jgi:hypothetical protein
MMAPSLFGSTRWVSLRGKVARAFAGQNRLPVYELKKTSVEKKYGRVRPLPSVSSEVKFGAWRLAHALAKTDCAHSPSSEVLWLGTVGFLLAHAHLFDWSSKELRLNEGMSNFYADFTRTGLAGRIAQGMALLFLEDRGYAYVGRFEAEGKRQALAQKKPWPTGKFKAPDFIAEDKANQWILAESKGSLVSPSSQPNIKGVLNDALGQLDGWDTFFTPQPAKSFAIGTFLREHNDPDTETSLIAFVDPEPEPPQDPVQFPRDLVRRANYASWLSLMGFDDAADKLRTHAGDGVRREVPVIRLAGHDYAFTVSAIAPKQRDLSGRAFWRDFQNWPFWLYPGDIRIEVIGIDLNVLHTVGSAILSPSSGELMELLPNVDRTVNGEFDGGGFIGSVFSDGSLLGEMTLRRSSKPFPDFDWTEVTL